MANFPFKATTQISLLCASFALFSLTPPQNTSRDAQFLKRMKAYWKEGDFDLAKRQIRSYLEENENSELNEEMHLLLGDLYLKDGNFLSALGEYELIKKEDLQEKIFYNKVLCLYETGKVQELADISTTFTSCQSLSIEQKNSIRYLCASSLFEHLNSCDEKDSTLVEKTKELFESCKGTPFENMSFYPLAKLYELNGNKKQAASYYEVAAKSHPEQSIDFLFQAALLRSDVAPELAISTFQQILTVNSPKSATAFYNCLLLQYKTNQFQEFVSTYEKHLSLLDPSLETSAMNLFGKSLYHLGDFEHAVDPLLNSLNGTLSSSSERTTQLMILECAHKIQNVDLYYKMFRNGTYPLVNDDNYAQAHLVYLDLLKAKEKYPEFIEESKVFLVQNPENSEKERVLWDLAYFLYQSKNWEEASSFLTTFIQEHPGSKSESNAQRLSLNCSLSLLQSSPPELISARRDALIQKIQSSLQKQDLFSSAEKETFAFELVKNLFLEERFEETLTALPTVLETNPDSRFKREIELIQTLCYLSNPESKNAFIAHAENLLQTRSDLAEADKIRLHLFNTYIQIASSAPSEEKQELLKNAADHLYLVFQKKQTPLKTENIEWLSEHYYALSKNLEEDTASPQSLKEMYQTKAISLFDSLLASQETPLNHESETYLFRISELLTWASQTEKKSILLNRFLQPQTIAQTSIQKQLLLELANTYGDLGDSSKALDLYQNIIQNYPYSTVRASAVLNRSKLLFSYLPDDQKSEDNIVFLQNLNDLKDLEIQRTLTSEPLHLEAGLEYIKWKACLVKGSLPQKEKTIRLLRLFRENFEAEELDQEDDVSLANDKKQVLLSYLEFAEVEILRLESSLLENIQESKELLEKAENKFKELLHVTSLPVELKKRMTISKQELK